MAVIVAWVTFFLAPTIITSIISALVTTIILAVTMSFLITRNILAVVPSILHKKDALTAGVVFATVLAPISGMTWWYTQINRRSVHISPFNHYRPTVKHLWLWIVADVNLAIKSGLTYAEREAHIGSECRHGDGGSGYR
jgi:hypothetical protein